MKVNTNKRFSQVDHGQGGLPVEVEPAHIREAYSVSEFCARMGIGRTLAYRLIAEGAIKSVVAGKRRLIPATEGRAMLDRLSAQGK